MRILDLFCGCGGFSLGFLLANPRFQIDLAIDNDIRAINTYTTNIDVKKIMIENIQDVHSNEILEQMSSFPPDIILASPPCESFSIANVNRKKFAYDRLYSDEKGRLVLDAIRIIVDLEPIAFVIENVAQVGTKEMQNFILSEFRYSKFKRIYFNFLKAEEFGIPSQRTRVFISNIQLQSIVDPISATVGDAFQGLPDPSVELFNHESVPLSPKLAKKVPKTAPGKALVYFSGSYKNAFRNYVRLSLNLPSPTVMGKSRFIHPSDSRLCTVREHARLMSYPDGFCFKGSMESQFNQIGESVPPLLSKAIALQVLQKFH
ncbi:MAG: DNA cytosine methyltransferase [Candidatus Hodarchaeota archaeon]